LLLRDVDVKIRNCVVLNPKAANRKIPSLKKTLASICSELSHKILPITFTSAVDTRSKQSDFTSDTAEGTIKIWNFVFLITNLYLCYSLRTLLEILNGAGVSEYIVVVLVNTVFI